MVMPPVNTIIVHTLLLPTERRDETVLEQARKLLTRAWQPVDENLAGKDYLIGDFSGADIMLGHAAFMSNRLGCIPQEMTNLRAYVQRISERAAFAKAIVMGL
jgi:glutathione S-transferase